MELALNAWLMPLAVGLTVVAVTCLADRCGARVGGFLATIPVTSLFGIVYLLCTVSDRQLVSPIILAGNYSVLASLVAIPAYAVAVAWSRGLSNGVRVCGAQVVFFILYLALVLAARRWLPLGHYLFAIDALLGLLLVVGLRRRSPRPVTTSRRLPCTPAECLLRFASGVLIMGLLQVAARLDTVLAAVLAVFPGIFSISLGIMGIRQSAEFSAQAATSGSLGVIAIALFIAGFALWIPALQHGQLFAVLSAALTACTFYTLGLWGLHRVTRSAHRARVNYLASGDAESVAPPMRSANGGRSFANTPHPQRKDGGCPTGALK
ncbi:MAG: hypothetical protein HY696_11790 [Deltaproteobacteria bacterium]|nr:hypothetical protein [Deltaproteobacteria bacterium]